MGIGKKLKFLMDDRNTNANELAVKLGENPQTIYSLIRRDSQRVEIDFLIRIAHALGVNAEYFGSDYLDEPSNNTLSEDEYSLVMFFRALNIEGKEKLLDYADDLVQSKKYIKNHEIVLGKEA